MLLGWSECKPQSLKGIDISELKFAPQLETDILQLSKPVKKTFSFGKTNAPKTEITKLPKDYLEIACLEDNFELWKRVNVPNPQTIGLPENYLTLNSQGQKVIKPHLYIEGFEVKKDLEHGGYGRETLNQIIQKSKDDGFEGRVMLSAMRLRPIDPSPAGFYNKCGFRPVDSKYEQILKDVSEGKIDRWQAPHGIDMYFPI